ncbi:MAG: DUF4474 domain-containing protein [Clostridia bacterium]|nr:DUF4474 domain-containing protein [Clostridia bacterium]
MLKSIISFVMAFTIATVSIVGLGVGKASVQAVQTSAVSQSVETKSEKTFWQRVGIFGFLWDDQDKVFYSAHEAWQRNFGYNKFYDFAAQFLLLYYDTCRVKFTYGGKDWLVQFWKGQYGLILMGAEVGVYSKDEGQSVEHYECADDSNLFSLGYTLYSYDKVLFVRSYQETWWLTGFVVGKIDKFSDRSQLSMRLRITLKDEGMRDEFIKALQEPRVGFTQGDAQAKDTFYVLGNDVYIMWNTDRNKTS